MAPHTHRSALRVLTPAVLLGLLPLSACGGSEETELHVLAAASLTEVFTELEDEFERQHERVDVKLSFGSSTTLAENATGGAPGDVLATADETSMQRAVDGGVVAGGPTELATNALVLVVPADNPEDIGSLADLAGTDWVRCADEVPCGRVARALLEDNGITDEAASLEVDVKAVLAKVTSGEADAGLVYATDARAAGDEVITLEVPGSEQELTSYVIAQLEQAEEPELAGEWIDLVTSEVGRKVLEDARFRAP